MLFFFFNDTATTEIYTLSLHDALPIFSRQRACSTRRGEDRAPSAGGGSGRLLNGSLTDLPHHLSAAFCIRPSHTEPRRSEEHTSELQSRQYLVCRLLLEKKKNNRQQQS